ncbi:RIP metalloprotease RseP [Anaeromicropila populeti]|uniref:Zinc metalloprotease n=1 Tax=Anaeromicropila populeti TaxID=37658 RepID=A0A1I6KJF6_9FIRM|nr:RIP metalloprotease RseP [Anaeromicropila populeti]SFR91369.1 regulator of sigma E protease [Anaeromicropila populeti]
MKIVIALIVFGVIIVIHELGHFLLAKKNGIGVTEFSIGMGPRIITVVKTAQGMSVKFFAKMDDCLNRSDWAGRTKYSVKLLPLGGSCMMVGEDEDLQDENAFNNKGVWARISVIFAGPFFNFILAFLFALIVIGCVGYDRPAVYQLHEGLVQEGEALQKGDVITSIDNVKIHVSREVDLYYQFEKITEEPVEVTFERDGKKYEVTITPYQTESGAYSIGFVTSYQRIKVGPLQTIQYSAYEVKFWISTTIKSLGQMIRGRVSRDDIAGPVGIVDMIGTTYNDSKSDGLYYVFLNLVNICILLSANLGVMNLLPIPALDGGRLVFLFIEAVRGKPIDREKEGMVHLIGLVALMILMVFMVFNDFSRIIG